MKTITPRILMLLVVCCWLSPATIGQITFVKTPEAATNTRQPQQTQGGLSQEKKKSLSKYGPEDAFPGASEQEGGQQRTNRTNQRRTTSAIPPPTVPSTPAPTVTPTPERLAATPTPVSTPGSIDAASTSTASPPPQPPGSAAVPISLGAAALLVFGALVYVVGSLRKKLKETR